MLRITILGLRNNIGFEKHHQHHTNTTEQRIDTIAVSHFLLRSIHRSR